MTAPTTSTAQGITVLKKLAVIVACVILCLVAIDLAVRAALPKTTLLQKTLDIQSPELLYTKLDQLHRFNGRKIIVLGDSLAFGRTMRDKGDADWENHTLPAQLQTELQKRYPNEPIMVANLGMNGVLPTDLDQLMRIVLPMKPDLIIFDLTLRSFSHEFNKDGERASRPWLTDISVPDGRYETSGTFHDLLVNHWYLYRLKDTFQAIAFDGQPATYLMQLRNKLDLKFKGQKPAAEDDLMLLMKARARYDRVYLDVRNPQVKALRSLLTRLQHAGQPAIGFYATENLEKREDLMETPRFNGLQKELKEIMATAGDKVSWVGPLSIYEPANYLDHVHLDQHGYQKLVTHLLPLVENALKK